MPQRVDVIPDAGVHVPSQLSRNIPAPIEVSRTRIGQSRLMSSNQE